MAFATYVNVDSWKIAYNTWSGINVQGETDLHNRLLPKNIYANGYIPIDLGDNGFTINDIGDGDNGPNDLLNYPVIVDVHGNDLEGDACAGCLVYFYRVVSNPAVNGGGGRYNLGMTPAVVDGDGHWSATLPAGVAPSMSP